LSQPDSPLTRTGRWTPSVRVITALLLDEPTEQVRVYTLFQCDLLSQCFIVCH
jgi:hypothetical protein